MHDVIIIGAGPAGLSAALWCDELGLDTLVLERESEVGGQLLRVHNRIENYLGVEAANGLELRDVFAAQADARDFDLWTQAEIEEADLRAKRVRLASGEELQSIAVVIATGVRRRRLGIPGEAEFEGRGVLSSGALERERVAGEDVLIVGGGDAAAENALLLAETCATVTLAHDLYGERDYDPARDGVPFTAITQNARGQIFLVAAPLAGGWSYRIDYPYYSWAETAVRPRVERRPLSDLLSRLNELEPNGEGHWRADRSGLTSAAKYMNASKATARSRLSPDEVAAEMRASLLAQTHAAPARVEV